MYTSTETSLEHLAQGTGTHQMAACSENMYGSSCHQHRVGNLRAESCYFDRGDKTEPRYPAAPINYPTVRALYNHVRILLYVFTLLVRY